MLDNYKKKKRSELFFLPSTAMSVLHLMSVYPKCVYSNIQFSKEDNSLMTVILSRLTVR